MKQLLRIDPHKVEALLAVEETRRTMLEEIRKLLDDAFQKHRPPLSLLTHSPNWYIGSMLPQIPEAFGEKPSTLQAMTPSAEDWKELSLKPHTNSEARHETEYSIRDGMVTEVTD